MRSSLLFLWWRVWRDDEARRPTATVYMLTIGISQLGWIALAIVGLSINATLAVFVALIALELVGPYLAEQKGGTPWHAHHIAERYGLLVIITLGEVILGTVTSVSALVHGETGWTVDAGVLAVAGIGLTFGCWWMYFAVPWAAPLVGHRERGFPFGYGHLVIFAALAAMGAGLHVASFELAGTSSIGPVATVLTVAIPFAVYAAMFYGLYSLLMRTFDPFHLGLIGITAGVLILSVALAAAGVNMPVCLLVLALAPAVTVVGYEVVGYRHMDTALERL
jgi:low temperature requirement protein LtrA